MAMQMQNTDVEALRTVIPAVVFVTLIVVGGLVILLRPIASKLGTYLEVLADKRKSELKEQTLSQVDIGKIATLLETIDNRVARLEERQEFTDKLLVQRPQQQALKE